MSKFKIGESVRMRSSSMSGVDAGGEYRVVQQFPQTDSVIRYRVRNSADERDEVDAKKSDLCGWHRF